MIRRLREVLLWAGAALGLVGIAAGVAVAFLGVDLLVFRSGSMAPDIPTGALAVARTVPAADLAPGDVVSVVAAGGQRVTHRVVSSTVSEGRASLVLKGDANAVADPEPYDVASAERVVFSVPLGGYVLAHALTPPGLVAAGAVALMLVVVGFSPSAGSGPSPRSRRRRVAQRDARHRVTRTGRPQVALVATLAVGVTVVVVAVGSGVTGTWALFTDRATMTTGSFASGSVAAPTPPTLSQTTGSGDAAISWPATGVGGSTAVTYDVVRYTSATGGTGTVVCANVATPRSCTEAKPATAATNTTYYYAVNAKFPVNWSRESATRTEYTPDVVAPTGNYSQPTTATGNVATCNAAPACGTAADPGGLAKVEFTLLRTRLVAGVLLPNYDCWTGAAYVNVASASCPTFYATTGTTTWSVPGPRSTVYATALLTTQSFTLVVRLTDTYGNVRTSAPINYS